MNKANTETRITILMTLYDQTDDMIQRYQNQQHARAKEIARLNRKLKE
jgi:hypothetical protein